MIRIPWLECLISLSCFAITGKIELVYEGEQEGAESVATTITNAVKTLFPSYFPNIEKLEKEEDESLRYC